MKLPWYIKQTKNKGFMKNGVGNINVELEFNPWWIRFQKVKIFFTMIWKLEISWRKVFGLKPKYAGAVLFIKQGGEWKPIAGVEKINFPSIQNLAKGGIVPNQKVTNPEEFIQRFQEDFMPQSSWDKLVRDLKEPTPTFIKGSDLVSTEEMAEAMRKESKRIEP